MPDSDQPECRPVPDTPNYAAQAEEISNKLRANAAGSAAKPLGEGVPQADERSPVDPVDVLSDYMRRNAPTSPPTYPITPDEFETLADMFTYHAPDSEHVIRYAALRGAARDFAEAVMRNCPRCADRSAAIRKITEAVMTANAAIARDGRPRV